MCQLSKSSHGILVRGRVLSKRSTSTHTHAKMGNRPAKKVVYRSGSIQITPAHLNNPLVDTNAHSLHPLSLRRVYNRLQRHLIVKPADDFFGVLLQTGRFIQWLLAACIYRLPTLQSLGIAIGHAQPDSGIPI